MIKVMRIIGIYVGIAVITGRILRKQPQSSFFYTVESDILTISLLWPILVIEAVLYFIYFALDYLIFKK